MAELDLYKVQRKVVAWEEICVEAESFADAKRIAELDENIYNWDFRGDESEPTDEYWIMNEYTGQEETF
jgi:hypothetical protein